MSQAVLAWLPALQFDAGQARKVCGLFCSTPIICSLARYSLRPLARVTAKTRGGLLSIIYVRRD